LQIISWHSFVTLTWFRSIIASASRCQYCPYPSGLRIEEKRILEVDSFGAGNGFLPP